VENGLTTQCAAVPLPIALRCRNQRVRSAEKTGKPTPPNVPKFASKGKGNFAFPAKLAVVEGGP
jgi:hypothetical protein